MFIHGVVAIGLGYIGRSCTTAVACIGTAKGVEYLLACISVEVGILDGANLAANIDNIVLILDIVNSWDET